MRISRFFGTASLVLLAGCSEPDSSATPYTYTQFQTRLAELSRPDGTVEIIVEPSVLATEAIIVYSEPSHRPVAAALDASFSLESADPAMKAQIEDAETVINLDLKRAMFSAQVIYLPVVHERYSYELWGRGPDGSQLIGIGAEEELEYLQSFTLDELREHDGQREEAVTDRSLVCCTCGGMSCGCITCGKGSQPFCNCVQCKVSCSVVIGTTTSTT